MINRKVKNKKKLSNSALKIKIERLMRANNLNLCLECGKCSSVCPMLILYGDYRYDRSPRGVVERMSLDDPKSFDDETLWYCLTCQECSFYCPSGVDFQNFMMALREILIEQGVKKFAVFCPICRVYLMPKKEFEYLVKDSDGRKTGELLSVCPRCKQKNYTETLRRVAR